MNREPVIAGIVALALMILMAITLWALFKVQVPSTNHDVLLVVIGVLTACVKDVVGFFFGSSSTSHQQQNTIAALANTAQTVAAGSGTSDSVTMRPGDTATATTSSAGTTIHKDTP